MKNVTGIYSYFSTDRWDISVSAEWKNFYQFKVSTGIAQKEVNYRKILIALGMKPEFEHVGKKSDNKLTFLHDFWFCFLFTSNCVNSLIL